MIKLITPKFTGKTIGIFIPKSWRLWNARIFTSGTSGPASTASGGTGTGYNPVTRTHVEGRAAQWMRIKNIKAGWLLINNPNGVCGYCGRCLRNMLPGGSKLKVITPANNNPSGGGVINPPEYTGEGP